MKKVLCLGALICAILAGAASADAPVADIFDKVIADVAPKAEPTPMATPCPGCEPAPTPTVSASPAPSPSASALVKPSVQEQSRDVVVACSAQPSAAIGTLPIVVDRNLSEVCRNPGDIDGEGRVYKDGFRLSGEVRYTLARVADDKIGPRFKVDLGKIRFKIDPPAPKQESLKTSWNKRAAEMFLGAQLCQIQIKRLWNRYGIEMNLQMDYEQEPNDSKKPAYEITISDKAGRSSADNYYFLGIPGGPTSKCVELCNGSAKSLGAMLQGIDCQAMCEGVRQREFCAAMMAHEIGHLLGFLDEYPDPALCPLRKPIIPPEENPWSMMYMPYYAMADHMDLAVLNQIIGDVDLGDNANVEFFPRHLQQLLSPLCPAPSEIKQ